MYLFKFVLSLVLLVGSALAQTSTLTNPPPESVLTAGSNVTVQISMTDAPVNVDLVVLIIGLMECYGGQCFPPSDFMGSIMYQGPMPLDATYNYANVTVTIPEAFPAGTASLNVINFFLLGASFEPVVTYLNETVTVIAAS